MRKNPKKPSKSEGVHEISKSDHKRQVVIISIDPKTSKKMSVTQHQGINYGNGEWTYKPKPFKVKTQNGQPNQNKKKK